MNVFLQKKKKIIQMPMFESNEYLQRVITTGQNYAYLKIGEGCSNRCTYCAIPYIRGPFVSRKMEEILEEAREKVTKLSSNMRYKIRLSYDGSAFCGWQIQNNDRTVQGDLEKALEMLTGSHIQVTGAGRTPW